MKNLLFLQSRFQRITNVSISIWKLLWSKGWSFFLLYTILYFIYCFTSWDKLKLANIQIELEMVSRYGSVSFWQLYPFQIVSIYFLYLLYLCFSIVLVFLYLKFRSSKEPNKLFQLTKKMTQSFFSLILCLFIGNLSIGLIQESYYYSLYLFGFWIVLFLLFIKVNGSLFSQSMYFVSDTNPKFTKSFGYFIPILWSAIMFWIVSV
ncbi:hypothetical protein [Leptospira levettii]|uniref:hypothetical protein n=1 Tax=Leptospira levettii TaxID=2023178 RepID=UPI001082B45F|nr:hypothetical protein [Leptospira levettii]TGL10247.1 hypothetical protein EHQ39_08835 [Leptospira levettii]